MVTRKRGGGPSNFLGTESHVPDKYTLCIREWISIQNIVTKRYDHPRIIDQPDACNLVALEDCSTNEACELYTRTTGKKECIDKKRKTDFRTGTITGKTGIPFQVLESKYIVHNTNDYKQYYYQIMLSGSNQRYVLFPVGDPISVMDNPVIQAFLTDLAIQLMESNESYCICGHSMGCVFSLNLGYLLHTMNPNYFKEKIVVIGSAPYKWLPPTVHFEPLENVLVFVCCRQVIRDKGAIAIVDCFYFDGRETDHHYLPYYMMYDYKYKPSSTKGTYLVKYTEPHVTKLVEQFQNTEFFDDCEIHPWENYHRVFLQLFPSTGGQKRSKRNRHKCP